MTVFADLITARRTVALGALVLALGVGCGSDDESGGGGGGGGEKEAKLAFVYPTTTTNFAQEMALGAKAAADATPGVKLTESAPAEVNGPKQVQLFQAATRTSPGRRRDDDPDADLFIRPLQQAGAKNVPLVAVDVPPPAGTEKDVKLLIGNSNEEIGAGPRQGAAAEDPGRRQGPDPDGHRHARPARARAAQQGLPGRHQAGAPRPDLPRLRRQAEPDGQLQHLERAGQGAPGRPRLRRPGQPGRGVALADPAPRRQEARRRRLRPRPRGARGRPRRLRRPR